MLNNVLDVSDVITPSLPGQMRFTSSCNVCVSMFLATRCLQILYRRIPCVEGFYVIQADGIVKV